MAATIACNTRNVPHTFRVRHSRTAPRAFLVLHDAKNFCQQTCSSQGSRNDVVVRPVAACLLQRFAETPRLGAPVAQTVRYVRLDDVI